MVLQSPDGQADRVTLYNANGYRMDITGSPTANRSIILPNRAGTLATMDQIDLRLVEKIPISTAITTATAIYTTASVPKDTTSVELVINGENINSGMVPAPFTVSGSVITWNPANAYPLDATDNVFVKYAVSNNAAFQPRDVIFNHWQKQPIFRPAFLNNWTNLSTIGSSGAYETTGYRRSPFGDCEVKGTVVNTTTNSANTSTNIFALPPAMCLNETIIQQSFSYYSNPGGTPAAANYASATFFNSAILSEPFVVKYVPPQGQTIPGTVAYHAFRTTFKADFETWNSWGDSVAAGLNASNFATNSYFALYCTAMGYRQDNTAVSGSELTNVNASAGTSPATTNWMDNYQVKAIARVCDGAVIHVGLNDMRRGTAVATYVNQLRQILLAHMANGMSPRRIIMCTPVWIDTGYYTSATYAPFNVGSVSTHQAYVAAVIALAKELGTACCDFYLWMSNNGGNSLVDPSDHIHPLGSTHASLALQLQNNSYYPT